MTASGSARAGRTPRQFLKAEPRGARRIEQAIRENSGLIAEKILGEPGGR